MTLLLDPTSTAPRRAGRPRKAAAPPPPPLVPFTVPHFRAWAHELTLDNGEPWDVEPFFEAFLEDYFAGIPECWLIVPEENSKTTSLAGLGVYLLEHRPNPSIPWAASSRDQAEIGYRQAEGLVLRSPRLRELFKCQEGYRRIKRVDGSGRMQIFAADDGTGDGVIPTDAFIDELHRHRNLRLYRTWSGKLGKRSGQLATISTAGEPGAEFELTRERIRQETPVIARRPGYVHCRSARIAFHEYALEAGAQPDDMEAVKRANPFRRITVETLAAKFATPTMTLAHWQRFVCDVPTRAENAAIQESEWAGAKATKPIPEGESVWVGLDVAWKWDTTSATPLWWKSAEHRQLGPASILVPPRDGRSLDIEDVKRELRRIHARNPIHTVVMDMSRAEDLAQWIEKDIGATVVDRPQTDRWAVEDYDRFMEALRNGWLWHSGDAGLTSHVLNAVARTTRYGDTRFDRPSPTRQGGDQSVRVIDALSAASGVHAVAATFVPEPAMKVEFVAL